jgi:hypothetical protein
MPKALISPLKNQEVEFICYSEAVKSQHWCTIMNTGFDALLCNGT